VLTFKASQVLKRVLNPDKERLKREASSPDAVSGDAD